MHIIRQNLEKGRTVFFDGLHYIKVWNNPDSGWIEQHACLLKEILPGYVADYKHNCISYNIIPGVPASKFKHTPEFIKLIKNFCLENINQTSPYAHGDWSLSNILIDGDTIRMCDWDNVGKYTTDEIYKKLNLDLKSAFGEHYVF
jgi:RIO-like serine/threonine protein kinase